MLSLDCHMLYQSWLLIRVPIAYLQVLLRGLLLQEVWHSLLGERVLSETGVAVAGGRTGAGPRVTHSGKVTRPGYTLVYNLNLVRFFLCFKVKNINILSIRN